MSERNLRCLAEAVVAACLCQRGVDARTAFATARSINVSVFYNNDAPLTQPLHFALSDGSGVFHLSLPDIRSELAALCKEMTDA